MVGAKANALAGALAGGNADAAHAGFGACLAPGDDGECGGGSRGGFWGLAFALVFAMNASIIVFCWRISASLARPRPALIA